MSLFLYTLAVLIWGTTFYAVTFQVGEVPAEQSVFYRYMLAAAILWLLALFRRDMPRFSLAVHLRFVALGLLMFSLNYVVVYMATERIPSGLVSVLFSLAILINTLQMWIFYGQRPDKALLIGGVLGIGGLVLLFLDEILAADVTPGFFTGLALGCTAAVSAASGNIVSHRLSERRVNVMHANTWSMSYGAVLTLCYIGYTGEALRFDATPAYVGSLLYLSLFGTVIAFYAYMTLIARIGAPRASYISIFYSMVALLVSTLFEGMVWNKLMFVGVAMILLGNVFLLWKRDKE